MYERLGKINFDLTAPGKVNLNSNLSHMKKKGWAAYEDEVKDHIFKILSFVFN